MTLARVRERITAADGHLCRVARTRVYTSALLRARQQVDIAAGAEQTQVAHTRHCNTFDIITLSPCTSG